MGEGWVVRLWSARRRRRDQAHHEAVRRVLDALPTPVVELDPELRCAFANGALRDWLPGAADRIVGSDLAALLGPQTTRIIPSAQAVLAGKRTHAHLGLELCGSRRELEVIAVPRRTADGEIAGIIAMITDVTERKQAEERERFLAHATEVLASSLDYQATLRAVADLAIPILGDFAAVEMVQEDGALEAVAQAHHDPARLVLAGELRRRYPPGDLSLVGRVIRSGTGELRVRVCDTDLAEIAHDEAHLELLRRMGICSLMVVPVAAHDVVFGALVLATSDDSRRHYTDMHMRCAEELARRAGVAIENAKLYELTRLAVVAREDLLAMVSHDLRNPLGAIRVKAEMMKERIDELADRRGLNIEVIQRAADRMLKLVELLTDASRISDGRITLNRHPVDVGAVARDVLDVLDPIALDKGVRVSLVAKDSAVVWADPDRIVQVVENLVSNAIKFTARGGAVAVEVSVADAAREALITVRDSGCGISPEDVAHVFDRYWQARRRRGSSGLGLFIAHGIVKAHGGRIGVESRVGEGTCVWFTLPCVRAPDSSQRDTTAERRDWVETRTRLEIGSGAGTLPH
jgi:PAS domain S-box-containing protein